MAGVLFDVGYVLMDERPRLDAAIDWLALRLAGLFDAEELHRRYRAACTAPRVAEYPSLIVQMLVHGGVEQRRAEMLRRELEWDRIPLAPYADALPALRSFKQNGIRVGVLANQPASTLQELERTGLAAECDRIWLSDAEGLAKPDPRFFQLAIDAWQLEPAEIAYVGDRPDNDVGPANRLGLLSVRVRTGPHSEQHPASGDETANITADNLAAAARDIIAALA